MASDFEARIRNVTAVLGPTNTGKTHLAIERMLGHESGMIGLPLRLLAREVYDKVKARVGADQVALITGEEKIKPDKARYWVSTVEAMPRDIDVAFLAIDEIQLCGDPERGHVFTDRLLHARGRSETLLLGAQTMREAINDLIPGANFIARPRLSKLTYSGEKKITRLPARSAIVAFSTQDVYSIAELIRRQRGGAAVVLGALSPRTRNAQVELYQSGDVEFIVATDAIGMGLNLDVDHVAFSATRKFDGQNHRNLTAGEIGQIAGRAGRYMNDGTFGVTGGADPLDPDLVERLEGHSFDSVRLLQWRNRKLDFGSLDRLYDSLKEMPRENRLARARTADDLAALEAAMADREIVAIASTPAAVAKLWDVCQVPDYRKISGQTHNELVGTLYKFVAQGSGCIPEDWFAKQVALADRTDGDIDTLATRIAHIRTWTFVANRPDWLQDPGHWQARTRAIEDSLSDALHERLTQRFVDRRTSALMKGMRDKDELNADIAEDGAITVENHFVGRLKGFRFTHDTAEEGIHGKATRQAATQVLTRELGMRARRVAAAPNDAFKVTRDARVLWRDDEIATLEAADDPLAPSITLLVDENLSEADREKVLARLQTWLKDIVAEKLKPLAEMSAAADLQGLARGIAFRLKENFGVLKRDTVADEINALDQAARADLRKYGLRFGAFNIFFPVMLKPAAADLAATLWLLKNPIPAAADGSAGPQPQLPRPGLTSVAADPATPDALYRANGFHLCGPRAVRLDILERLADLIRPLLAFRLKPDQPATPPKGSTGDGGFRATDDMMSILGCSADELGNVLKALGFRLERRLVVEAKASAAVEAVAPAVEPACEVTAVAAAAEPVAEQEADTVVVEAAATEAVPAEVIAADAPPASAEGAAVEAAKAEEKFEDIWRPRRHPRAERPHNREHQNRRDNNRGRNRHAGAGASAAAATAGEGDVAAQASPSPDATPGAKADQRPDHRQNRGPRRERHSGGNRDGAAAQGAGNAAKPDQRGEGPRPGKPGGGYQGKPGGGHGGGQRGDRPREGGRGDRGPDRAKRDDFRRQPEVISAAPPKRAGIDPDSPFAKLAALKANMDKRGDGPG
ncbi:MAG: helicase [Hyphomicrobium sp.]|nr:helicase [Hyphomicrobium sp.]